MKTFKYFLSVILFVAAVIGCTKEEFGSDDFVSTAVAPSNLNALFTVTQDNTGTVTITPNSDGAVYYMLYLGDGSDAVKVKQGKNLTHVYPEGIYEVKLEAFGITGLKAETTENLVVSFKAPENLVVDIKNDLAISKQVNVTATADHATMFEVYFGEEGNDDPVMANIGETASYIYKEAGTYTIRVVAKGAAIETTEFTQEFTVTAILQPLTSAPTPKTRNESDYISIYSGAYNNVPDSNYNPDWGQSGQGSSYAEFDLNGDKMLNYIKLSYQGIDIGSAINAASMEFLHIDIWTADEMSIDIYPLPNGVKPADEKFVTKTLVANQWNSFDIPMSEFTDQGLPVDNLKQFKFVGAPWAEGTVFIDNLYFYKAPSGTPTGIVGTWKIAPQAKSLGVGPGKGDISWWSIDAAGVALRDCFYNDTYIFNADGSFNNVLGADTWVEGWQGGTDSCGTPVAPHDGSAVATYTHNKAAGTVTLNGKGAYLGIPKAINGAELSSPAAAPASVTYEITLANNDTEMTVDIKINGDGWWRFQMVKEGGTTPPTSPIAGTWVVAPEAKSLGVGPGQGDTSWWSIDAAGVTLRDCFYDDTYVFNADGSFSNVLGADTWIEGWQGGSDACGAPVAPHNGAAATYTYDAAAGKITLNGKGAYLGIPKAVNGAELSNPADAPAAVTYDITLSNNNTEMIVDIKINGDGWWRFKMIKEGSSSGGGGNPGGGGGSTGDYNLALPIDFESTGFGANWTWNVFENDTNPALEFVANPNASGINNSSTVAKITALKAGQPWVGTETAHGTMGITWDLSASNAIVKIMVYKTVISDVGIKFANPAGGAQVELKVANTKINEWEELTFDFSARIGNGLDGSTNIDQIIVFPDFNTAGRAQDNVVYFDNITFQ